MEDGLHEKARRMKNQSATRNKRNKRDRVESCIITNTRTIPFSMRKPTRDKVELCIITSLIKLFIIITKHSCKSTRRTRRVSRGLSGRSSRGGFRDIFFRGTLPFFQATPYLDNFPPSLLIPFIA